MTSNIKINILIFGFLLAASISFAAELKTKNVILITTDGFRWQELFTGAEKTLIDKEVGGVEHVKDIEQKFWRETPEERRQALMPFVWSKIASEGQIFGNVLEGSQVQITNKMKFSYPGYNEILTGANDPKIDSNDKKPNKNVTVLEWLHRKPTYQSKVAAFSAWDVIPYIINRERCGFPVMGGWESVPEKKPNAKQELLNELIADTTQPNRAEVIDSFLFQAAREHLLRYQPRVFYIGLLETDHWGHRGRYDHLLTSAHAVDSYIQRLWELLQSIEQYRDKTTLIITTDHGRGSGRVDWKNHGKDIEGAEYIWMAFLGPDTPALGERKNCQLVTQSQIAATLAAFLGEDYRGDVPQSGEVIQDVLPAHK